MSGVEIRVDFKNQGAVFNGMAELAGHQFVDELRQKVADITVQMVKNRLSEVLRHNTGTYISYTHEVPEGDTIVVTDRWIVYGPWLEGVGSRVGPPGSGHWPLTRFEGYHTYRIVAQEVNARVPEIAAETIVPYLRIMNS